MLEIISYIDLFLYDCKQMDTAVHKKVTGAGNKAHFQSVGKLADELQNVLYLEVLPYHPLGLSKANLLNRTMEYDSKDIPESKQVDRWVCQLQSYTDKKVIRSKV